jgi:uncharacterized membrane protein
MTAGSEDGVTVPGGGSAQPPGPAGVRQFQPPLTLRRLTVAVSVGVIAAVVTALVGNWPYAPSVGWDATGIVFCAWTWIVTWPLTAEQTAQRATAEDPGRANGDLLMLSACVASLAALALVLVYAHSTAGSARVMLALLAVLSVAVSWFSVHTIFALRYARLYYRDPPGGIDFKQSAPPDYRDFAYVAATIGMTFQVSDTDFQNSDMRSAALRHALLSYLFGAVILAAAVNLVAGLGSAVR